MHGCVRKQPGSFGIGEGRLPLLSGLDVAAYTLDRERAA